MSRSPKNAVAPDDPEIRRFEEIAKKFRGHNFDAPAGTAEPRQSRTDALANEVVPYLRELLEHAPQFGTAGITLIFHEGQIVRIDSSASVQRKVPK